MSGEVRCCYTRCQRAFYRSIAFHDERRETSSRRSDATTLAIAVASFGDELIAQSSDGIDGESLTAATNVPLLRREEALWNCS